MALFDVTQALWQPVTLTHRLALEDNLWRSCLRGGAWKGKKTAGGLEVLESSGVGFGFVHPNWSFFSNFLKVKRTVQSVCV